MAKNDEQDIDELLKQLGEAPDISEGMCMAITDDNEWITFENEEQAWQWHNEQVEKQIEKTKDRYYDTLKQADAGWYEEENDPTPFIRYMLQVILSCYIEFEDRVGLMTASGEKSTAYDIVRTYTERKIGKFTGADVVAHCPSIGRSSALAALKRLTEEGYIVKEGTGKNTYYVRADSK